MARLLVHVACKVAARNTFSDVSLLATSIMGSLLLHADLIRTWFESHSRVMQTTLVTSFKSHLDFKLHYISLKRDAKRHWLQHTATYSDGTKFSAALFLAAPATNNGTPTSPIRARGQWKNYLCGLRKNPRGDPKKDFCQLMSWKGIINFGGWREHSFRATRVASHAKQLLAKSSDETTQYLS